MIKMLHIINRETARKLGMVRYFTGKTCRNGHDEERLVSNKICLGCARDFNKLNYERALRDQRKTEAGRERRLKNDRRYLENNREQINARRRELYAAKVEFKRKQKNEWSAANKASVLATQRKIKFLRMQRAPKWLTEADWVAMEAFYTQARTATVKTGVQHHVDHVVPLVGKLVSGLHVPWNLQVLTADENIRKSNKHLVT